MPILDAKPKNVAREVNIDLPPAGTRGITISDVHSGEVLAGVVDVTIKVKESGPIMAEVVRNPLTEEEKEIRALARQGAGPSLIREVVIVRAITK